MNPRDQVLQAFSGSASAGSPAPLLLDLTLWHKRNGGRGSLPADWQSLSQCDIAGRLGAVGWMVARPWSVTYAGVGVSQQDDGTRRSVRFETPSGDLTSAWMLGPDGDWWQTEYPVKSGEDLPAAHAVVASRRYEWDASVAASAMVEAGSASVVALELPMRPYSDLLHTVLGWSEGLMLFAGEQAPILADMVAVLEEQSLAVTKRLAALPGHVLYAPDNLDGQYISPRGFRAYLLESYRNLVALSHEANKPVVVHAGGPVKRLLPLLLEAGVDTVEGIAGPPQSDATLAEARSVAGNDLTLWGGIPQDLLVPVHSEADFTAALRRAALEAAGDPRVVLGVADRVSVDSDLARLQAVARTLQA